MTQLTPESRRLKSIRSYIVFESYIGTLLKYVPKIYLSIPIIYHFRLRITVRNVLR